MTQSLEQRIKKLEDQVEVLMARDMAHQNLIIPMLLAITQNEAAKECFITALRGAVEGSFSHALGSDYSDEIINISRDYISIVAGPEISREIGL